MEAFCPSCRLHYPVHVSRASIALHLRNKICQLVSPERFSRLMADSYTHRLFPLGVRGDVFLTLPLDWKVLHSSLMRVKHGPVWGMCAWNLLTTLHSVTDLILLLTCE